MKYEEAIKRIEYLKNKAEIALINNNTSCEWLKKDVEGTITAFSMAIEELEKQESKSIYELMETRLNNEARYDKFRCSVCGFIKEFADGHTAQYKYCPQCGSEIDWSDADDN